MLGQDTKEAVQNVRYTIMSSSHHRLLSCLVRVGGVNRIRDKSRLSATENFETFVQPRNAV